MASSSSDDPQRKLPATPKVPAPHWLEETHKRLLEKQGVLAWTKDGRCSSAQKWLEEALADQGVPPMQRRHKDFVDSGDVKLDPTEEERLAAMLHNVRLGVSLRSARFNSDGNTTMVLGRPVQVPDLQSFSMHAPNPPRVNHVFRHRACIGAMRTSIRIA